eukprot:84968-Pleurochrysis_carterae.AAC.1
MKLAGGSTSSRHRTATKSRSTTHKRISDDRNACSGSSTRSSVLRAISILAKSRSLVTAERCHAQCMNDFAEAAKRHAS